MYIYIYICMYLCEGMGSVDDVARGKNLRL